LPFRRACKDPAIGWEDRRDILVPHLQVIAISPGLERPGYRMLWRQFWRKAGFVAVGAKKMYYEFL
jgi:hypothetical protein